MRKQQSNKTNTNQHIDLYAIPGGAFVGTYLLGQMMGYTHFTQMGNKHEKQTKHRHKHKHKHKT